MIVSIKRNNYTKAIKKARLLLTLQMNFINLPKHTELIIIQVKTKALSCLTIFFTHFLKQPFPFLLLVSTNMKT